MSKYFVLPEKSVGEGGDIVFRRHPTEHGWYRLFVGDKELGFITKNNPWKAWDAWSYNFENKTMSTQISGFKTRLHAGFFIVKHWGYWNEKGLSIDE